MIPSYSNPNSQNSDWYTDLTFGLFFCCFCLAFSAENSMFNCLYHMMKTHSVHHKKVHIIYKNSFFVFLQQKSFLYKIPKIKKYKIKPVTFLYNKTIQRIFRHQLIVLYSPKFVTFKIYTSKPAIFYNILMKKIILYSRTQHYQNYVISLFLIYK